MAGGSTQKGAAIKPHAHPPKQQRTRTRASTVLLVAAGLAVTSVVGCGATPSRPHAGCRAAVRPPATAVQTPRGAAPSFVHSRTYHVGRSPASVAVDDVNGDGAAEIVTANTDANTVSVLKNRGDGTFDAREDHAAGRNPESVVVADLNCDGSPDIVDTSGRSRVSVLLNRGSGHFETRRSYESGPYPSAVVAGDLDRDSDPDLAVAGAAGVSVLLNDGDGSFEPRVDYATGSDAMGLALADLDGDGALDFATASSEGESAVLLNRGDGTFRDVRRYDSTSGPTWVAAGDLDGRGAPDVAVISNDWSDEVEEDGVTLQPASAYVFPNKGNGSFAAAQRLFKTFGYDEGLDALVVGDVDGNAKPDLVVGREIGTDDVGVVLVLLNNADGGFLDRLDYLVGSAADASGPIAVGDLNGDGRPDLVTVNPASSSVSVFINRPGRCTVQDVSGTLPGASGYEGPTFAAARRALERAECRVGKTDRTYSPLVTAGHVISQKPKFGAVLRGGARVDLVISKGPKR
jgi:hypothetical protein